MSESRLSARDAAILSVVKRSHFFPRGFAESLFFAAGVGTALWKPRRLATAYAWASAHESSIAGRWRTLVGMLAHAGRAFGYTWTPILEPPAELRDRFQIEGREHLDAAVGRPRILLGFHMGLTPTAWVLRSHGYDCVTADRGAWRFQKLPVLHGWPADQLVSVAIAARDQDDRARTIALLQLRRLLLQGRAIRLIGDGHQGNELFRIPLSGGALVVRSGWWALRRATKATVLPVLTHRRGSGGVVTAYPPLPDYVEDAEEDLARCRERLAPLVQDFVSRHPAECLPWRFGLARSVRR